MTHLKLVFLAFLLVGCSTTPGKHRYVAEERPRQTAPAEAAYPIDGSSSTDPAELNKLLAASLVQCIRRTDELQVLLEGNHNEKATPPVPGR